MPRFSSGAAWTRGRGRTLAARRRPESDTHRVDRSERLAVAQPMRVFPDPDPIERFFDPEELPHVLEEMPQQDRARRLRLYLIARCALGPEFPVVLWHVALDLTSEGYAYAREVVDAHPDDEIARMVSAATRMPSCRLFITGPRVAS